MWEKHKSKLIVVAVCLIAAVGLYVIRSGGQKQVRPDKLPFVCVETGKIYWIKRRGTMIPPVENPETKHRTLLPARKAQDGHWEVVRRYRNHLKPLTDQGLNKAVDAETGRVRNTP